jgi:hypothetical protein
MEKINRKQYIVSILLVIIFLCQGCATIFQPGPDRIPVNSTPKQGAKIYLDGQLIGVTPSTVSIPRSSECVIRVEMEGYEPIVIDRDKHLNGWIFGNILIGGIIGIAVDLITHNQGGYSEDPVVVELVAKTESGESKAIFYEMKKL